METSSTTRSTQPEKVESSEESQWQDASDDAMAVEGCGPKKPIIPP